MQDSGLGIWIIDDRFLGPQLAYHLLARGYRVGYSHSLKAALNSLEKGKVDGLTIPSDVLEVRDSRFASALFVETVFEFELPERERLCLLRDNGNTYPLLLNDISLILFHIGTEPLRKTEKEGLSINQIIEWNHEGASSVVRRIRESNNKTCVAYSALPYDSRFVRDVRDWGFNGLWDVLSIVNGLNLEEIRREDLEKCVNATLRAANEGKFIEIYTTYEGGIEIRSSLPEGIRGKEF